MILARPALAVAGLLAAPAPLPVLPAPALGPSLTLSAPVLSAPSLAATPAPVLAATPAPAGPVDLDALRARGWVRSGPWLVVLREGTNAHGQKVLTLDALDADAPRGGTVGHVDLTLQGKGAAAVLDGPLSPATDDARLPPGAAGADLSHWRAHLWFGFAVVPAAQGRGLGAVLLDAASRLASREGAPDLIVYATVSSRSFYLARFGAAVLADEPFTGADDETYHRLVVRL